MSEPKPDGRGAPLGNQNAAKPDDQKAKNFGTRLYPAEREALQRLAEAEGVSMAQYLRNYIHREAEKAGIPYQ